MEWYKINYVKDWEFLMKFYTFIFCYIIVRRPLQKKYNRPFLVLRILWFSRGKRLEGLPSVSPGLFLSRVWNFLPVWKNSSCSCYGKIKEMSLKWNKSINSGQIRMSNLEGGMKSTNYLKYKFLDVTLINLISQELIWDNKTV